MYHRVVTREKQIFFQGNCKKATMTRLSLAIKLFYTIIPLLNFYPIFDEDIVDEERAYLSSRWPAINSGNVCT